MPVITAITPQKRRKGRYSLFIDDDFFIGLDEEVLYHGKLKVGQEVNPDKLKELVMKEEYSRARQYVLSLLSRRLYSCHEVHTKMVQKGYETPIIEKLIADFTSKKYLNDHQFAESWVETRLRLRPRGPVVLRQELTKKGIDREIINEVLTPLQSTDELVVLAEKTLHKKKNYQNESEPRKRKQKIYQYLGQKGFSPDVIRETTRRILDKSTIVEYEEQD